MADDWQVDGGVVTAAAGVRVARLAAVDVGGTPLVAIGDAAADAIPARSSVPLAPADAGRSAVLVFEDGDQRRPIIIGLLQDRAVAPAQGAAVHDTSAARLEEPAACAAPDRGEAVASPVNQDDAAGRPLRDVRIDGRRITLEAKQELTLRCGQASVTLRADGRIVIKGMEIVSRARGTHKVKGATVLIN